MFKLITKGIRKAREVYKRKGICYCGYALFRRIKLYVTQYSKKIILPRKFEFQGKKYHYFYHHHNCTWTNERVVEIPLIWTVVKESVGKRILELGNVLSHYYPVNHDILDKYEQAERVTNEDIVDFNPDKKYDLIVSISTLEHIGWDEKIRIPKKTLRAVEKMKNLLAEGGKMIITSHLGYNYDMDCLLKTGELKFDKVFCMKRISKQNKWKEATWDEIKDLRYAEPYPYANGIFIGIIEK